MARVAKAEELGGEARVEPTVVKGGFMAEQAAPLKVGDMAPAIEAETSAGGRFSLQELRGKWVVVYFYPRANTPG